MTIRRIAKPLLVACAAAGVALAARTLRSGRRETPIRTGSYDTWPPVPPAPRQPPAPVVRPPRNGPTP